MYEVVRMALYQRLLAFVNVTKLAKVTFDIQRYASVQGGKSAPPSLLAYICQSDGITIAIPKNHFDFSEVKRHTHANKNGHLSLLYDKCPICHEL